MDKAVEIKRRAQRCVQNGDLDGALNEYQKLVAANDTDPYNFVLLADLLFKKGDPAGAADRYLTAAAAYETAGLYKNGIAVCKKMMRLSLAPARVLKQLATLHAADGLGTEAALYFMQFAEHQVRAEHYDEAADALRRAFDTSNENIKALERLAEVLLLEDDRPGAARALAEAAHHYARSGQLQAAEQCRRRGREMDAGAFDASGDAGGDRAAAAAPAPATAPATAPPVAPPSAPAHERADSGIDRFERTARPAVVERDADLETSPPRLSPLGGAPDEEGLAAETESANGGPPAEVEAPGRGPDEAPAIRTIEAAWTEAAADPPGLHFGGPAARPAPARSGDLAKVEKLLAEAQEAFRSGDRERAGATLAQAAETYESAEQFDQAATIYRSLARSAQAPAGVLERWLANCEKRGDASEAAHVACELGDRELAANRAGEARGWFERALAFEPGNALAARRLQRLGVAAPAPEDADAGPGPPALPAHRADDEALDLETDYEPVEERATSGGEGGRVELAVGRGEAVTFDLGSLISEFQRGVEAQLSGDAQSHYDLAMAYREMGLLEQAVDSFRIAQRDLVFADRCAEMIGRCLLDQGRFEDAAVEFREALESGRLDVETEVNLRYQLGLAHEAAGRLPEALVEFENVYAAQPNYPDVALKIRILRKSLESH